MINYGRLAKDFLNNFSLFSHSGTLGSYGDIIFTVSRNKLLTPTSMDIDFSSRTEEHENLGEVAYTEFLHRNLRNISFNIKLISSLVDIPGTILKLEKICENGEYYPLILGGKPLSEYGFMLVSFKEGIKSTLGNGELEIVECSLTFKEYIPRINRMIVSTENKMTSGNQNQEQRKNKEKNKKALKKKSKSKEKMYSSKKEERKWLMGLQEG
ncbi:Phage tail protein [Fusobacterium necrophorum subsp. funduliforme]|uniref:phage tail protein n=1 Tax=Fusobacterium necrophorum TaxID=859 RepID=UPI00078863C9|nr:phage tail protein [Fusobacterium necrophorum]KYL04255.1 hypothetical protein A2J06_01235 [Fusobacterium necrophorum subsp. funduliforme]KYM50427.1 hypothetical protein A2U11_01230 [Fusobacterium necrophorum subsp. funduliforme]KYM51090.1 hypothetical protein A2U04_01750 [Fusobacterium necrophorum subsp. funduliforme]MDK4472348.1 phage tail protein [Fusobacterium necrophorum]MDK4478398.1 phage tail protein [Fusobacterium necrophorum]